MLEKIIQIISQYKGSDIDFALTFEKSGGTLPGQLEKLFLEETKRLVRTEKEKLINELEQNILVFNNIVLMGKLTAMREKIEEESNQS